MPRRVVTGEADDGTSFLAADEEVPAVEIPLNPGANFTQLWATESTPQLPLDGSTPALGSWFPGPGGFRFFCFSLPAVGEAGDPPEDFEQAAAETNRKLPGLLDATFDEDTPGRHRSDTIDALYVIAGRIVLILDDGTRTTLEPGDSVVQNGTFHNWENPGPGPVVIVGAAIGALDERS